MKADFKNVATERLKKMLKAGHEVENCQRVLTKVGENIVADLLKGSGTFFQMNHYPEGDVYDHDTHGQYYYHAHRDGEHGHFHLFLRPKGMPKGVKPLVGDDFKKPKAKNDALSHLIAISMDAFGAPQSLFTTNRWVTAEYWYDCEDVIKMLDHFEIDHASPSWPANRWVGAMVQLYYPQICDLLRTRDHVIEDWKNEHPDVNVFEDRHLEITSELECNVHYQIAEIEEELKRRT
ncbi:conserved hypothetical protein [Candidatus Terasakiella magnetica]|uniref:DUF6969 domain-containing protein n=1 Tax=Candidatus Terasakiella magnetica TaxID=1867952 RepID=A0A1C3RKL6_9PROT|nr:hypothetical protein [Candidatus Terasakiella magnetica]SCA57793.1 conserved hypothetical protein [Candidatus Terasakiella magnetica]